MIWKSNLNDIDTETLDETSGIKASAASNPRASTAPNQQAPRPASHRGPKASAGSNSSRQKIQTYNQSEASPNKSAGVRAQSPSVGQGFSGQKPNIVAGLSEANADQQYGQGQTNMGGTPGAGVTGSGEELALTLEKVVSQLDIISRTLHVLEQRVSMNEESVQNCLSYFQDAKRQRESATYEPVQSSMQAAQMQSMAE